MFSRRKALILFLFLTATVSVGFLVRGMCQTPPLSAEELRVLRDSAPGQSYEALIRAVRSRPVPGDGLVFVVLGDSRGDVKTARMIYERAALEKPAFVLHTGDMVDQGTVEEFREGHLALVQAIAPVPVIPVPGNHEAKPTRDFAGFRAIYGGERFSFDYGESRFIGINNGTPERLRDSDLQFLERELAKPGSKTKFVVMHVPPLFVQQYGQPELNKKRGFTVNAEAFRALMARERVAGVFFGHDHGFAFRSIDGVPYAITGGAGAELYYKYNWLEQFYHYIVVRITHEGVFRELVRLEGDRWVRSKIGDDRDTN